MNFEALTDSIIMSFPPVKYLLHISSITHDVYYSVGYNTKIVYIMITLVHGLFTLSHYQSPRDNCNN